jgi:hypothetical protein
VGLLGEVAENMGDRNINANGGGGRGIWGKEVNGDIKWPAAGKVGDPLGRFQGHVVFGADEVGKGCQELEDGIDSVTDVVMEAGFKFFGEAAGEKMVTIAVAAFGAERAQGRLWGVKKREAELAAKEEAVPVSGDAVVLETSREGVEGNAGGRGEEGGEEISGGGIEGGGLGEEMGGGVVVVKTVLEASGGDVEDQCLG